MDRQSAIENKATRYIGRICPKHANSFKGERYTRNSECVGCHKDRNEERRLRRAGQAVRIDESRERRQMTELEARAFEVVGGRIKEIAERLSNVSRGTQTAWRDFWAEAYGAYVTEEIGRSRIPLQGVKMPETGSEDRHDGPAALTQTE